MELLKLLSANELVAQIVNFIILVMLMRALGWKKILGFIDARRERIAAEFDAIERQKAEMASMKLELQEKMKSIEATAARRMAEAANEANETAENIKKEARREAERIIASANSNVQFEANKIKAELKDKMVELVVAAAEQVIAEKMDVDVDRKIVEEFIANMDKGSK